MPRALAIDYGLKRTGLAITDDLMMIASPLETVETRLALERITSIASRGDLACIVVGEARHRDGSRSEATELQDAFVRKIRNALPGIPVERVDERYSSQLAAQALVQGGMKKKDRMKKENLDKVSAALILQWWLDSRGSSPAAPLL